MVILNGMKSTDAISSLVISSMRHNYVEFVDAYGFETANISMAKLFGEVWLNHRHDIWQWYDQDYRKEQKNGK